MRKLLFSSQLGDNNTCFSLQRLITSMQWGVLAKGAGAVKEEETVYGSGFNCGLVSGWSLTKSLGHCIWGSAF